MSLDFYLNYNNDGNIMEAFHSNITHNVAQMAREADVYKLLWHPEENGYKKAHSIIRSLEKGLKNLKKDPDYFRQYSPSNGSGSCDLLIVFVEEVLDACKKYPNADIHTST
jgi:hypothetical protein